SGVLGSAARRLDSVCRAAVKNGSVRIRPHLASAVPGSNGSGADAAPCSGGGDNIASGPRGSCPDGFEANYRVFIAQSHRLLFARNFRGGDSGGSRTGGRARGRV